MTKSAKRSRKKVPMPTFKTRLKRAMQMAGVPTPEELAKRVEVSPQVVRKWLRSERPNLSAEHLVSCARVLSVRAHWLATGEGPMSRFHASQYTESDMLKAFRSMSERERVLLRDMAGLILKFSQED